MKRFLPLLFISTTFIATQVFAGGSPGNDLCANAEPISCGQTLSGSTSGGSATGAINCGGAGFLTSGPGVWYTFIGDGDDVTLTTCGIGSDFDTQIGVFSGSCGALVCEDGNDDDNGCGFSSLRSTVTVSTVCGQQYFVYISGFLSASGNFDLTMTCAGSGNGDPLVSVLDVTVQLDGAGEYSFNTPLLPEIDVEVLTASGATTNTAFFQSFQPTRDGILDAVEVTFGLPSTSPTIEIRDGVGFGGTLLYSSGIGATSTGTPTTIDILATIDLTAGNDYSIVITDVAATALQRNDTDPYAGGISSIGATTDLRFSVAILQRPEIDNGTSDDDGIEGWALSQTEFDCNDVGSPIPVTLTATDKLGNTSSCVASVTVEDNEAPVAACVPYSTGGPNTVAFTDAPGTSIPDNNSSGVTSTQVVSGMGTITDLTVDLEIAHTYVGDLLITLESPNNTTVTLVNRPGVPASLFGCGDNGFDINLTDASANDLETTCFGASIITGDFYPFSPLSAFDGEDPNGTWTIFISDNAGGDTGTLTEWTLNVEENVAPTVTQLVLDGTGNYTVDPLNDIDNGSSDNCSVTLTTVPASFSCAEVGLQSITLTATDPAGLTSSCSTTVEVVDNSAPTAVCQDHTLVLDGSGAATLTTGDIDGGSSDNCGISTLALDQTAFNCSNVGANTVELTVTDVNGNSSSCSATVTVEDNEFPTITCPANIEVCSESAAGATVSYATVTGDDNCAFSITQTDGTGLSSGSVFPIGDTNQEWTNTDASGNQTTCSFTVTVNASPTAAFSASPACQGLDVFFTDESTIDASSSIVSWSWDMGDGSAPVGLVDPSHVYAATGSYDVELTVTSAESCVDVITQTIEVGPVPTASFTTTNACEGAATTFTNTSTVSSGTLTYAWDFGDTNTSTDENPSHTYAVDGTYTVTLTVTSDLGCEDVVTQSVEVYDSPNALFSASTVCDGGTTTFTNLSSGATSYSWDFGDSNGSTDANPTHAYATAGIYTVVLTAANDDGCVDTHTANVTVNALPNADFTFSDVCEGTAVDFVNASDAGSYNWDLGDGNSSTLTNVSHTYASFGTYNVTLTVTDANFCINSVTQTVEVYDLPDFTVTTTDAVCYGEATGTLVVNPQGSPTFPWDFSINGGTPQINDTFLNLPAGSYDVTVVDDNGCEFTLTEEVGQPADTLGLDINAIVDVACHGEASGEIDIEGTGGTAPYMYSIDAGPQQSTGMFSGLLSGSHDIQIVDANLCVFDTTITLTEPDTLVLVLDNSSNLLCNGDNSGEITVSGTGGVAPYEYNLDGGVYGTDNTFGGLAAGAYVVGVLDANGCTDTVNVTLTEPGILMLSLLNSEDANCFGESSGSIEVAAASGTPGYQYSLDGVNYQGSGLFDGLAAGTYTVTVQDANGCLDEVTETIFEPSLLTMETSSTPVACFGNATGEIVITANGGTPGAVLGYNYSIDGGGSFDQNGGTFTDLVADEYLVVVSDTNGCTASESVIISEPSAAFELSANVTNALCLDSASGTAMLIGTGGTPTYSYSSDNVSFGANALFEGYAAGSYTLYGQDVNGCTDSVQFVVGQPSTAVQITNILLNNPACPNEASGTATVSVSGGTPGYTYSSNAGNTFQASQILTGINGGNHLIVVQDSNGCTDSDTITLVSPPLMDIVIDTIVGVACEGDANGELHVLGEGGTPSYNYTLDGGSVQTNGDFTGLSDGVYTVMITDVNGCAYSEAFTVEADQLLPVAAFDYILSGMALLTENLSENGESYLWTFGDDSTSTEESPVHVYAQDGNYTVTLTVTNGCGEDVATQVISTTTIGIDEADEITFSLFPNPTTDDLNLRADKDLNEELRMEIVSVSGQLIRTQQLIRMSSRQIQSVDINGLAGGIYFLRIIGQEQQSVLRFDIIK